MKLVIKGATEELEKLLKEKGYEVDIYEDDVELFTEVEKEVEVEKPLPEYLELIKVEIEKLVDEKLAEKEKEFESELAAKDKEYEDYKAKVEAIRSIFGSKEVVEEEPEEEKEEE